VKELAGRTVNRVRRVQMARDPQTLAVRVIAVGVGALAVVMSLGACGTDESANHTTRGAGTTANDAEADVARLVERFMKARQAGLPADEFLSAGARVAYEEHETGLWLHDDTLPGGPGGEYARFSVETERAPSQDLWKAEVRIRVTWLGDAEASGIVEVLTVGPGANLAGDQTRFVVLDAARSDDPADDGIPPAVAEMRQDVYKAAVRHDYKALRSLLDPATFSYSFGESGEPIGYWREQEAAEIPLVGDFLPVALHSRFSRIEDIFMWPSAAAKEPSAWTEADLESMRKLGYTDEDIRSFEQYGGYTGWRVGIRADGTWLFFISGD
jgi:hypothetical protein